MKNQQLWDETTFLSRAELVAGSQDLTQILGANVYSCHYTALLWTLHIPTERGKASLTVWVTDTCQEEAPPFSPSSAWKEKGFSQCISNPGIIRAPRGPWLPVPQKLCFKIQVRNTFKCQGIVAPQYLVMTKSCHSNRARAPPPTLPLASHPTHCPGPRVLAGEG